MRSGKKHAHLIPSLTLFPALIFVLGTCDVDLLGQVEEAVASKYPEIHVKIGTDDIAAETTADIGSAVIDAVTTVTVTVENRGDGELILSTDHKVAIVSADPGIFALAEEPSARIAAGASSSFTITFSPTEMKTYTAAVQIESNDADEELFTFIISGTGTRFDAIPPAMISIAPGDEEDDVEPDAAIVLTFSEAMNETLTKGAFSLSDVSDGSDVAGVFTWSDGFTVMTFTPTKDLKLYRGYTVSVTTAAADTYDNPLTNAWISEFTTRGPAGTLDVSFATTGWLSVDGAAGAPGTDDKGYAVTTDPSGKILVAGYSTNPDADTDMVIWRYNGDGSIDTSFGSGESGAAVDGISTWSDDFGNSITIDGKDRIVVAGSTDPHDSDAEIAVWRFDTDGALDATFDSDGVVTHGNAAGGSGTDAGYDAVIDSGGRILVAGKSLASNGYTDMAVWRFNENGSLDTTFDGDGFATHDGASGVSETDVGAALLIDGSGRITVTGFSQYLQSAEILSKMVLWRYDSGGQLDAGFSSGGFAVYANPAAGSEPRDRGFDAALDSTGRILVAGSSWTGSSSRYDLAVWRHNADGSLDATFGTSNGVVFHHSAAGGGSDDEAAAIAVDAVGKIVVTGYSYALGHQDMTVWRFNADGTLDASFGGGDGFVVSGLPGNDVGNDITIDSSGRIVVTGSVNETGSHTNTVVWRFE